MKTCAYCQSVMLSRRLPESVEMVASAESNYACWPFTFLVPNWSTFATISVQLMPRIWIAIQSPPFFSRLLSRRWIVETNASPFSRSFSFVKCEKILRLKQSTTSPRWNFFKQLNYAEDEKGVFEKQEAVPLADGQTNGLMGMPNEWAILQGAAQRLVEFCIESVN